MKTNETIPNVCTGENDDDGYYVFLHSVVLRDGRGGNQIAIERDKIAYIEKSPRGNDRAVIIQNNGLRIVCQETFKEACEILRGNSVPQI